MMTEAEVRQLLVDTKAVLEGHFLLTSGLHSPLYVEKFNVLQHPEYTEKLCKELAERFKDKNVQTVMGPMTGGILLAHEVGKALGTRAIFTEREKGVMTLRRGFRIEPGERVLIVEDIVTTGGSEAVLFAFMSCLNPGDEIIVPEPAYANYMAFAISAGAVIRPVVSSIEQGFALPDVARFEELINERTRGILICNPNNPTGYLYTRREMDRIRDLVRKYDLFLFSDEVYREFIYTGSPYISACHLEGIEQNVVLIDSVSKRYSECGIRIGALITKNRTLRNAVMKFCQARLSPPLIGQIVAEASIDAPRSYSTEVYEEYIERRKCLIDGLNRLPGVYSPIPMGAFYTVARLPVEDSDDFCAWCLSDFDYEGETVMLAPASGFYSDPACGRNEVRIAYVLKKEDLERALVVLGKALEAYNNRK